MTPLEDLSLLRAFVSIVESRSISAAARTLKIPQPSLSRRLRMLEENCGMALLRRDTHRMSLTEAGGQGLLDLDEVVLAPLKDTLYRDYGFSADLKHLAIFGRCKKCS